jgi:hypothetical protein
MVDEFTSHSGIQWNGHVGTVQYGGGDRSMVVLFYTKPIHNPAKSRQAGSPIYEDCVYVKIHPPGERLNIVDRPSREQDRQRWPVQWAQFQQNQQQIPEGTPIDLLYPDHPSVGAMLKAHGVYTIEMCAELSGPAIEEIGMGAQRYCNDAQKYLKVASKGVAASQLRAELDDRDRKIASLEHTVQMLHEEIKRVEGSRGGEISLGALQQAIAGLQGRPTYSAGGAPPQAFDAQTAQINATHATTDLGKPRKRQRARIQG